MLLLLRVSALIQFAWLLGCSAPRGNPPREERADGSPQKFGRPAVLARTGEARMLQGRKPIWIKVDPKTLGSTTLTVGMEDIPPGDSIGVHKHLQEDEIVFVHHRGEVDVTLGDTIVRAHAGATAFYPRGGRGSAFGSRAPTRQRSSSRSTCRDSRSACGSSSAPAGVAFTAPPAQVIAAAQECHQVANKRLTSRRWPLLEVRMQHLARAGG